MLGYGVESFSVLTITAQPPALTPYYHPCVAVIRVQRETAPHFTALFPFWLRSNPIATNSGYLFIISDCIRCQRTRLGSLVLLLV